MYASFHVLSYSSFINHSIIWLYTECFNVWHHSRGMLCAQKHWKICIKGVLKHIFLSYSPFYLDGEGWKIKCNPVHRKIIIYRSLNSVLDYCFNNSRLQKNVGSTVLVLPYSSLCISVWVVTHTQVPGMLRINCYTVNCHSIHNTIRWLHKWKNPVSFKSGDPAGRNIKVCPRTRVYIDIALVLLCLICGDAVLTVLLSPE